MFGSTVLEVGIGLIFTFLTISLICGSVTETVATVLSWRSKTLMTGVQDLLNDSEGSGLALQLYNTALVHPRGAGTATSMDEVEAAPAYIDPKHFAQALLDAVAAGQTSVANIRTAVLSLQAPQLQQMLLTMITHAGTSVDTLRDHIASWFDSGMDRVSGVYKRRTQLWCFMIGLAIAAFLNIDTLHIATVLWQNPNLAKGISVGAEPSAHEALKVFQSASLPFGWTAERAAPWATWCQDFPHFVACAVQVLGWVLTAGSTLFGTSFWYDALSSVLKLRGSGPAPAPVPAPAPPAGGGA